MTINALYSPESGKKTLIVGVGGTGCRVVSALAKTDLPGVVLAAVDTDWASVRLADAHRKVELRHASIYGHGSGGNQEWARRCAEACLDQLRKTLGDPGFALIIAGMGGGTGTGASPVIAGLAAQAGIPATAVVTLPAQWEGFRRSGLANEGLVMLRRETGALLAIPLAQVQKLIDGSTTSLEKFYDTAKLLMCDCIAFLLGQRDTTEFAGLSIGGFQVVTGRGGMAGNLPDGFLKRMGMLTFFQ